MDVPTFEPLESNRNTDATWPGEAAAPDLPAGVRIAGRYELHEVVGRGSFSTVYRAWDPILRRQIALKLYLPGVRFQVSAQEIALQSSSQHPSLMPLFDAGTDPNLGVPYAAMPLYPGCDLATLMEQEGPQPIKRSLLCVDQLCSAVEFLWRRRRAIHGDVKPANVWMTADGTAVLMDFNLRGCLAAGLPVQGTPGYTPPEALGGRRDPRSDVFSLGCVLYELLTGRRPFKNHEEAAGPPPPAPSRYRQELFPWLDEVVLTALARDPQGRFEGAAQFRSALRHGHLLYGKGLTARMSRWLAPGTPGGRMAWLVAALLLMCGAGWSSRARLEGLHLGSLWVAGAASIPWLLAVTAAVGRPGRRRDWEAAACSLLVPGCEWRGPMSSVGSLVTAAQLAALLTIWCPLLSGQVGWGHPWSLLVAAAAWIAAARVGFLNCRRPRRGWSPSRIGLAVGILAVLGAAGIAPWLLPALAVITAALFGSPAGVACASPVTAARILWGEWDLGRGLLEFFVLATACSLAGMPGRTRALRTGGAALAPSLLALFLGNATPLFLLETWIGVGLSAACAAGRGRFWPRVRPGRRSRRR